MAKFKLPTDLDPEATAYMQQVIKRLRQRGALERVDEAALLMLARDIDIFIRATKQVAKDGIMLQNAIHPAVNIAFKAQVQAANVMSKFGLTVKDREAVPKLSGEADKPDPLEAFMMGGGNG